MFLALTNQLAGRTELDAVDAVLAELREGGEVEHAECGKPEDLGPVLDGLNGRTLVVIGGDGSLHTTVKTLWQRGESRDVTIGLVPLGTGNDFARGVNIPLDGVEAARLIRTTAGTPVDLVTDDDGGIVVNAVHIGVGAEAAVIAKPLKPKLKIAAFPLGGLLAGIKTKGLRLKVEIDGQVVATRKSRILMAGVANAPSIAGGTATLGPGATITDGLFDVTVSKSIGPLARAGYAIGLIRGTHPGRDDVIHRKAKSLSVAGDEFHSNADGEITGPFKRRTWTIQENAWNCILGPASEDGTTTS